MDTVNPLSQYLQDMDMNMNMNVAITMTTVDDDGGPAVSHMALYHDVKAWIAQQEAYEVTHNKPAPLTNAQRKALEALRLPAASLPPPAFGAVDYVSLLYRYRQAHPAGEEIAWVETESGIAAGGAVGRVCQVAISEAVQHPESPVVAFPAAGYGIGEAGSMPVYTKKKDAKQYAAKCAVDWLIAQSLMPSNLSDVVLPRPQLAKRPALGTGGTPSPLPKRQATGTPGGVHVTTTTTTSSISSSSISSSSSIISSSGSMPASQRVATLCQKLGMQAPRYVLTTPDPSVNCVFDGYPDFLDGDCSGELREGGEVRGVLGKDNARQTIAGKLLVHLVAIETERRLQLEELLSE